MTHPLVRFLRMDLWVALQDPGTMDEEPVGVYTTEELALEVAGLASYPDQGAATLYVLDEVPDWVDGFVAEQLAQEQLGERSK